MHEVSGLFRDAQREVDGWIGQFEEGYWPPLAMLARLTEEVGELAREINHSFGEKPRKPEERSAEISEEIADVAFVLLALANSLDVDMDAAFEGVMNKYRTRDQTRWTPRTGGSR